MKKNINNLTLITTLKKGDIFRYKTSQKIYKVRDEYDGKKMYINPYSKDAKGWDISSLRDTTALVLKLSNDLLKETIKDENDELIFMEGKDIYRLHKSKERNKKLIHSVKKKYLEINSKLNCQVCDFSFIEKYGELGEGFIEAHHVFPISKLTKQTETKIEDIILVCSNCHRMLHRKRPWVTLDNLKNIIQ